MPLFSSLLVAGWFQVLVLVGAEPRSPLVIVEDGSGSAVPCALADPLAGAFRRHGWQTQTAPAAQSPTPDTLLVWLSVDAGTSRLRVRHRSTDLVDRELRPGEPGCEALTEVAALVMERHLQEIFWPGEIPSASPLPAPPEATVAARPAPASGAGRSGMGVSAGAVGLLSGAGIHAGDGTAALSLDVSVFFARALRASLWLLASDEHRSDVDVPDRVQGTLRTRKALALGTFGRCALGASWDFCAGLAAGATALFGDATGSLYRKRARAVIVPTAGAYARVGRRLFHRWELAVEAGAAAPLAHGEILVEDTGVGHALPAVEGWLALRVGWLP